MVRLQLRLALIGSLLIAFTDGCSSLKPLAGDLPPYQKLPENVAGTAEAKRRMEELSAAAAKAPADTAKQIEAGK